MLLRPSHRIEFAEPAYNASIGENPEFRGLPCEVPIRIVRNSSLHL